MIDPDDAAELARERDEDWREWEPPDDGDDPMHRVQDRLAFLGCYDGCIASPAESQWQGEVAQMYDALYGKGAW